MISKSVVVLASAVVASFIAGGHAITRNEVVTRAQDWATRRVPYSQGLWTTDLEGSKRYRQDCSGYVSMAWRLPKSLVTSTLGTVATEISKDELQRGDMMLSRGHAILFDSWADAGKTSYWAYEQIRPSTKHHVVRYRASTYKPYRYNGLTP